MSKKILMKLTPYNKMLAPALFTIRKGRKRINTDYEKSTHTFLEHIDQNQLNRFISFLKYQADVVPETFLYLIAQRAQLQLMLEKDFPFAVPGMVHLENEIEVLGDLVLNSALSIDTKAFIKAKEEGSLIAHFESVIHQSNKPIYKSLSVYLIKIKGKKKKKEKRPDQAINIDQFESSTWTIKENTGMAYAKVSNDFNLIHISNFFAKVFGFKRKIIHGWYTLSRLIAEIENAHDVKVKKIKVVFKKPIFLPSKVHFHHKKDGDRFVFKVTDLQNEKLHLEGECA